MNTSLRGCAGFTLLSLITALSIGAIFTVSAIPTMRNQLSNQKLTTSGNQLLSSIMLARSEAIKTNGRVTINRSETNWEEGWIIYSDENDNGHREDHEPVLLEQVNLREGLTLRGNNPVNTYISYVGNGQAERFTGSIQMGTLMLCDEATEMARAIIISSSGRARISKNNRDFKSCV